MRSFSSLFIVASFLCGCETLKQFSDVLFGNDPRVQDPQKIYRYDMGVTVNGINSDGILVSKKADSYEIFIEAKQKLDLLTARTCHREISFDPVKSRRGLFGPRQKEFKFIFIPNEMEKVDCPIELYGYSKISGKHSFAFLDFENSIDELSANVSCNGDYSFFSGVSLCQSRHGLRQKIKFREIVKVSPDESCPIGKVLESDRFDFSLQKGICTYIFMGKTSKKTHRLTTIGYEEIIISTLED